MKNKTNDFWVFVETNEDGTAKNVGIELLTPGRSWQMPRAADWWPLLSGIIRRQR